MKIETANKRRIILPKMEKWDLLYEPIFDKSNKVENGFVFIDWHIIFHANIIETTSLCGLIS